MLSVRQTELSKFSFPKLPVIHVPHYLSITFKITFITWNLDYPNVFIVPCDTLIIDLVRHSSSWCFTGYEMKALLVWHMYHRLIFLYVVQHRLSAELQWLCLKLLIICHREVAGESRCYHLLQQQVWQNLPWDNLILGKTEENWSEASYAARYFNTAIKHWLFTVPNPVVCSVSQRNLPSKLGKMNPREIQQIFACLFYCCLPP